MLSGEFSNQSSPGTQVEHIKLIKSLTSNPTVSIAKEISG